MSVMLKYAMKLFMIYKAFQRNMENASMMRRGKSIRLVFVSECQFDENQFLCLFN